MRDSRSPELVRAVGFLSLTAIAINGTIGAGIFVLPATVAKLVGPVSPFAFLLSGLAAALIVLCFAEVGGLFERTGGPYVYASAAFGSFVGFEIGWMFLMARLTAMAALSNAFAAYLAYFWPIVSAGAGRACVITVALSILTWLNLVGVRYGAWTVNLLTVGKLVPLVLFISVGLFYVDTRRFSISALPELSSLREACLVLIFAFGGFEFASVPTQEVINPRRNLPVALLVGMVVTALVYVSIQIVALGTLPALATATAPLASAAQQFAGSLGAAVVTLGAVLSTTGTNSATLLVGSRMLYALAEGGQLPAPLARVHPRFRTPYVSVIVFGLIGWALAMYSDFVQLAAVSAIARLVYYITTCLAVPVLRRKMPEATRRFTLPGRGLIPALAVILSLWLLTGSSRNQAMAGGSALLLGAGLYWVFAWLRVNRAG